MKSFTRWLDSLEKSGKVVAKMLKVSEQHLSNLRNGHTRPSIEVANRIASVSGGTVPVDSWGTLHTRRGGGK